MNDLRRSTHHPAPALPKSAVVLGAARQGLALTRYLAARGVSVVLSDMKPDVDVSSLADLTGVRYVLGEHPLSLLEQCDVLYLSGGVPLDLPIVAEARQRSIPLSNDAQLFFEVCPAPILAITGSAGKTTTTSLVGEMLKTHVAAHHLPARVWVGGNIGNPLINDADQIQRGDHVVMELSSFQLELMSRSPHIACITNITPNHLDRHATMDAYIAAKRRIVDFQSAQDWQVLNADDPITRDMNTAAQTAWFSLEHEPHGDGAWLDENGDLRVRVTARGVDERVCHRRELVLMGRHNIANVLAAATLSVIAGASMEAVRSVATTFSGVPHRLQRVAEVNGVRYYDDSIATAPERLMAALQCFEQPVILLCGGRDKHLPWTAAVEMMRQRCKHIVLFGEMAGLVHEEIKRQSTDGAPMPPTTVCNTLDEAVQTAASVAQAGDIVLLSPGGTSYDAFKDFAERGDHFAALVADLMRRSAHRAAESENNTTW
ncbi:MAG: UDP-N-acetylmuramoyl-L-alanine--D-glutamate ligase [Anaerolineae bacterium]|nr:UDP-N-acetylmuramoyl-L-alanine--D-glutamate ligase [Thermoflexales bacterium]MDW8406695.1 UDP-N-acetylmuramoyl-L-alanine--D-glutamate ligase [Anaerolineae bacterium]